MALFSSQTRATQPPRDERVRALRWARRRDVPLTILGWVAVAAVVLWALGHVIGSVLLLAIAALLAYALYPAVRFLRRYLPRGVAIALVYLVVLCLLGGLIDLIVQTAIEQFRSLASQVQMIISPGGVNDNAPIIAALHRIGISNEQIKSLGARLGEQATVLAGAAPMFLGTLFDGILRTLIVGIISIYLLLDGPRVARWLRTGTPLAQRGRVSFFADTLQRVVGGYIRGQLTLALLIGVLVGVGMALFRVPYAVLLGVLAFVLEFIPVLGTLVSGAVCVLVALSQGWLTALLVLGYFVVVHILEGDIVGPRIVGRAIGLHPAVSIIALFAGSELFGIWGALFASPLAGVMQAVIVAFWQEWKAAHPEQFPTGYNVDYDTNVVPVTTPEAPGEAVGSAPGDALTVTTTTAPNPDPGPPPDDVRNGSARNGSTPRTSTTTTIERRDAGPE